MLTRLTHAAIAFAVTAVLYQAYVLAVVPFVEPPHAARTDIAETTPGDFESGALALDKHRELLEAYFPPDHWCFARPPKTLGNGQLLIIVDEYQQSLDGKLLAPHCALVFFQRTFDPAGPPPRDAVILESSHGAMLQLEQSIEKAASGFGRIQFGELKGEVIVRSDMREPGPKDDLLIKTRDLYMNEDLVRTDQTVDIKLGEHHGFGRELEIRLLKTDTPSVPGFYGSFEDLVIKRDVSVSFSPGESNMLGTEGALQAQAGPAPPIRIKSGGPFRIDFGSYKATFEDQVRTWQLHPNGQMDELQASKLTLFFTKTNEWNSGGADPTAAKSAASAFSFEPASLEALGTPEVAASTAGPGSPAVPVVFKAPSQETTATGGRLWIEMARGELSRITLEEGDEVVLTHRGAEIHARTLRYTFPPEGSGQRLGSMSARGGGGWMRAIPDPAKPYEELMVTWKDAMQLLRRNGQPVLVLDGRPKVQLSGMGTLWADQLQLFLREQASPAGTASRGLAVSLGSSITPERITATGRVGIESNELNGKVNQLDIRIHQEAPAASAQGAAGAKPQAATGPFGQASSSPFGFGDGGGARRSYNIEGVTLEVDMVMRDRRPDVRGIRVDGNVIFQEMAATGATPPLRIEAEQLRVTGADTPNAKIDIIGGGGQNGAPVRNAEITAGGAVIKAPALSINRGRSEALINSPGTLTMLVDRDLAGNPLPAPQPLDMTWKESMKLEGRRITFLGDVQVKNASGWLNTRRLVAQLTQDIRFDGGGQGQPQLEQLECHEGAVAEFEQRDISGVVARHRMAMRSLIANQINGKLEGTGPGTIDSVHFAKNTATLLALPGGNAGPAAPQLVQAEPELRHLHIDFVRSVDGNLLKKIVWLHGDVQAVYGPVSSWEEKLVMSPGGNPEPGVVWITADSLGVAESPAAQMAGPKMQQFELMAQGRVTIEGQDKQRGRLVAYGHRASFDQSKGLFILEGDGKKPATIEQQAYPGAVSSPQSAQRFTFNQNTGTFRVDGVGHGQFNQTPPTQQSRQPGAAPFR